MKIQSPSDLSPLPCCAPRAALGPSGYPVGAPSTFQATVRFGLAWYVLTSALIAVAACDSAAGGDGGGYAGGAPAAEVDPARLKDFGDMVAVYGQPTQEIHQRWQTVFQDERMFEQVAEEFNAEYALPAVLEVQPTECGVVNSFYDPSQRRISLCYELLGDMRDKLEVLGGSDEERATLALEAWFWVFYHELGHALVDLYGLPITGAEEDAVDQFSTVLFVEEGHAEFAFAAAVYWKVVDRGTATPEQRADAHALNAQRMYDILCLIYGEEPTSDIGVAIAGIPELEDRLPRCAGEWEQARSAWDSLLAPWRFQYPL